MRLRALLGTAVAALALLPAAPAQAAAVNDFTCKPSAAHPRPVVLLHGLAATGETNWGYHGPKIAAAGYCTFHLSYAGFGPIAESAQEIGAFIDQVLAATGATKVDLVGHSEGGFHSLYVPKVAGYAPKVGRVVALAPPTHGTTFANIVTLGQLLGGQELVNFFTNGFGCYACTDLIVGGPAVLALNDGPIAQPGVTYTVIATRYDELVTPTSTSFVNEPGVTNYYIQDKCPFDPVGHIGIATDTGVTSMILNGLDPTTGITCGWGHPL